ncbi:DNA adenine methylase [Carboxylicivirga sp. RSCT41]|uniref:DNA adenine methylase n=1 Tax=Carboxylicivirga agarovorans TaxID=3417570 RepID=UPI003D34F278
MNLEQAIKETVEGIVNDKVATLQTELEAKNDENKKMHELLLNVCATITTSLSPSPATTKSDEKEVSSLKKEVSTLKKQLEKSEKKYITLKEKNDEKIDTINELHDKLASTKESDDYTKKQVISYFGNKRYLLDFIGDEVQNIMKEEGIEKVKILDGFSGSGVVARILKQYASELHTNDIEPYSHVINSCYLANKSDVDLDKIKEINQYLNDNKLAGDGGILSDMYAPKDDTNIQKGERVFFSNKNAKIIDNIRGMIDHVDKDIQPFLLGPLFYSACNHANTNGGFASHFKADGIGAFGGKNPSKYHKNRPLKEITLPLPLFSEYECDVINHNEDCNELVKGLKGLDIAYFDIPYCKTQYGSYYHMLNTINTNIKPTNINVISGKPKDYYRSKYASKLHFKKTLDDLIKNTDSKYILLSFNDDDKNSVQDVQQILSKYGEVSIKSTSVRRFSTKSSTVSKKKKVNELLFVLKKENDAVSIKKAA